MEIKPEDILFPHERIREEQDNLVKDVKECLENSRSLIAHAPTGLGKTAATLAPALKIALEKGLTVFFLTSRHTQHQIAIETLKAIKNRYGTDFKAVDIIGKKWLCSVPGIDMLYSGEFAEYCKAMREENKCEFYNNTKSKNQISTRAKAVLSEVETISPLSTEEMMEHCANDKLCPYELSIALAAKSNVIITDYYYLFHKNIRDNFLAKAQKEIPKSIIIVDEAHNLPFRVREIMTERLSSFVIKKAIKEAKKYGYDETTHMLSRIQDLIVDLSSDLDIGKEKIVNKERFIEGIEKIKNYDELIEDLEFVGDTIRTSQKQSSVGAVAKFLQIWKGPDKGFARMINIVNSKREPITVISYRCLDPSLSSKEIFGNAYASIIMSGTLTPTAMYKDILGMPEDTLEKEYENPFSSDNKLSIIIPETTTKFSMRSAGEFKKIGQIAAKVTNLVPGNSAIFFPSYYLRDQIYKSFYEDSKKTCFLEQPKLTKKDKAELLERFKAYKDSGAVLLGVASGSFSEGIDLPGDLLKCVIVVGLPLTVPDLETKELINYFDAKFGKGWDYGYIFPAMNKTLQAAGRCIRSEKDKGVVVFLDERYSWTNYLRCFNQDWDIKITKMYDRWIEEFFDR